MSATSPTPLDISEQQVRIERNMAETRKLLAEADKFRFGPYIAPVLATAAVVMTLASLLIALSAFLGH